MLRSRSNRQQRASESTDEQHGRREQGGYYGGYPSTSAASPSIGVASGADDDYYSPSPSAQGSDRRGSGSSSRRFSFGVGSGSKQKRGSFGGTKGGSGNNVWEKKRSFGGPAANKGGGGGSLGLILYSMALLVIAGMGGATFHYHKAARRTQHELSIVERQTRGRHHHLNNISKEDGDGDNFDSGNGDVGETEEEEELEEADSNTPKINPQDLIDLRGTLREHQAESSKWMSRVQALTNDNLAMTTQIDHLKNRELTGYESRIAAMQKKLQEAQDSAKSFKEHFQETHKAGGLGVVPGGPGHTLRTNQELEQMETLDDYEDYVQRREDALWDKIDKLVERMSQESRREAEEWFGPGPHRVEFEIEYPQYAENLPPEEWSRVRGTLVMEMAPLSAMPIAVNLFLQQVHHKLWNGIGFVINAGHILQAGPHRYKGRGEDGNVIYEANDKEFLDRFEKAMLDRMPFQEYDTNFPHAQWTVGFAGRPGGPDFYVNKMDNTRNHGPGGQAHHDLHEEADPCFGRLVGGMEVMREVDKIPIDRERGFLMYSVTIVDSRVIVTRSLGGEERQEPPQQQIQQQEQGQQQEYQEKQQQEQIDVAPQ